MMGKVKVAYFLQNFPVLSESFIIDEILFLSKNEIKVSIFSFAENKTKPQQSRAELLLTKTVFAVNPKSSLQALARAVYANLFFFLRNPALYLVYFSKYFFKLGKKEFLQIFYLGYRIKKERISHLHAHFAYLGATAAMILSVFLKIPFSFTVHARDIFVPDRFLKEKIKKAEFIIAISQYNKEYLLKNYPDIPAEKIKVIPCGVDIEKFRPFEKTGKEEISILAGGRLVEKKGFIYLIRACKALRKQGVKFKCTIFGDGPLKEKLVKETISLSMEDLIIFKGAACREEIQVLFRESEIFVLPSIIAGDNDRDGIAVVLMEAMAAGLAVISTDISGMPELINSGKDGILVSQKDETKLSHALLELIKDKELRLRLGKNAREKIEREFNLSKNAVLLADLFRSLCNCADSRNFRILYVNGTSEIGGAEVSLFNLLKKLDRKKFSPLVVTPSYGPLVDKLQETETKIFIKNPLTEFSRKRCFSFLLAVVKLAFLVKKEKVCLVHANSIYISEVSLFAAHLAGAPCICHVRDLAPILGAGKIRSVAFKKMHKFIAISDEVKKDLVQKLHIPENKVTRIYNGVDLDEFYPDISAKDFRREFNLGSQKLVGMVGRFSPEKGQEIFLRAAAEVLKTYDNVAFIVTGDAKLGSEQFKQEMLNLTGSLGLASKVIFTGFRKDLAKIMPALDILVVPSVREPFGRVIIEAFAAGVPVIAANSGAARELVTDTCGILFAPDSIKELAADIIRLLINNLEAQNLAKAAKEIVEKKFSIEKHVCAIEELYRVIIEN